MVVSELKGRTVYILLFVSLAVLFLAYQARTPFELDLGATGDEAYISGFHDPEQVHGLSFRWSSDRSSIVFPGIGGYAPALLRLRLSAYRPADVSPPRVTVRANGREIASFLVSGEFETYELPIGRDAVGVSGTLRAELRSETFVPHESTGSGDQRELGVLVDWASVEFQGNLTTFVLPAPLQMIFATAGVLASYLLARGLVPSRWALATAIALLIGLSWLLATSRMQVTPYFSWVLLIPALALLVVALAGRTAKTRISVPLYVTGVAAILLGLWRFANVAQLSWMGVAPDLANNYHTAAVLRSGGMIYDVDAALFTGYDNPPLTALLHTPLTLLDLQNAIRLFFGLNTLFLATSVALVFIARREYLLTYPYWMIAVALVLNLDPVLDSLLLGQLDAVILLLIVTSFFAYRRGRDLIAGSCLALATMVKFSPLFLILYFLLKKRLRVVASAVVATLVIGLLSLTLAGFEAHKVFVADILPTLLAGSAQMDNQSLNGFFNRLFLEGEFITELLGAPSLPQVRLLGLAFSILLVGATICLIRGRPTSRTYLRFDVEYSLVVITLPLLSSIAWHHYMAWYVLPFLILLNPELRDGLGKRARWIVTALSLLCFLILSVPIAAYAPRFLEGPARLLLSMRMYSGLALFAVFAYLLLQQRTDPSSQGFDAERRLDTEGSGNQPRDDAFAGSTTENGSSIIPWDLRHTIPSLCTWSIRRAKSATGSRMPWTRRLVPR
jgi:hypothetical protein